MALSKQRRTRYTELQQQKEQLKNSFDTSSKDMYNGIKGKRLDLVGNTTVKDTTTNEFTRHIKKAGGIVDGTISLFKWREHYNDLALTVEQIEQVSV